MAAASATCVVGRGFMGGELFNSVEALASRHRFDGVRWENYCTFLPTVKRRQLLRNQNAAVACVDSSRRTVCVADRDGHYPSSSGELNLCPAPLGRRCHGLQGSRIATMGIRSRNVTTMAIPENAVWITALEAVTVAGLMGLVAVVAGIFINIKIETMALKEYYKLKELGQLPEDMTIPDSDWDLEEPLFVLQRKELSANPPARNRPVREEIEAELTSEVEPELEAVTSDKA